MSNLANVSFTVELTSIDCGRCGGTYAINERYRAKKAQDGGGWHCPYCQCSWGYFDNNENARLKRELEQERQRKADALARANEATAARDKLAKQLNRHKTRAGNGLCPCCNRSFVALARHMRTKHPEYTS